MNVTEVVFSGFYKTQICGLYQYDYGQVLKFTDITLPSTYEVHFAQSGASTTVTVLGDSNGVQIPDQYLLADLDIRAYIYLHEEETDGETVYQVLIPVIARPEPSEGAPTPVEVNIITQAIAALNDAVTDAAGSATDAANSARDADDSADAAAQSAIDAQQAAESLDREHIEEMVQEYIDTHPIDAPVTSVNSLTGDVVLDAADVGALPDTTVIPTKTSQLDNDSGFLTSAPVTSVNGQTGAVSLSIPVVPTNVSAFNNDAGYLTSAPVTSVNSKTGVVTLNASDVGALPSSTTIPTKTSDLVNDSGFITSAPVSSVNTKTGAVTLTASDVGAYVKPSSGIPKNDLATAVQTSLGKADTALQSAPVTSVNGQTGAVTIGNATTSAAGLMSATDKSHLDDVYADYSSALAALGV